MADNVIYGVVFGKVEAPMHPNLEDACRAQAYPDFWPPLKLGVNDTAPSEYVAPSDDCA
jgi:hypothetical protein